MSAPKRDLVRDLRSLFANKWAQIHWGESLERILKNIIDLLPEYKTNAYNSLSKVEDYLYEATYDHLDYEFAKEYFKKRAIKVPGACSAIRSGNFIGRHLDWLDNYEVAFVVHTPKTEGRHEVLGVSGTLSTMTKQFVESKAFSEDYSILPFYLQDGVNDAGLFAELNVVPVQDIPSPYTVPEVETVESIGALMLGRYILDNFDTVDQAVNYIKNYVEVYMPQYFSKMGYELHYLLADATKTVVMEFIEGKVKVINQNKLTNFHLYGVTFNEDGSVYTNADVSDGHKPSSQGIEPLGSGLERWNLLNGATITDLASMRSAMDSVKYSKAYTLLTDVWNSEFVGGSITTDTPANDEGLVERIALYRQKYEDRTKDNPETWITVHRSIYDLQSKKLYVTAQENDDEHVFQFSANYVTDEVVGNLADLHTDHKSDVVAAINEVADGLESIKEIVETNHLVIALDSPAADVAAIYQACVKDITLAKNIVFFNSSDSMYYTVNGYKFENDLLHLHTIMEEGTNLHSVVVKVASNGTISV